MNPSLTGLRRAVAARPDLLERLLAAESTDAFVPLALGIARELGLALTEADLAQAMRDARREHIERWLR